MLRLRPWKTLGGGDFGWLKARHHFTVDERGTLLLLGHRARFIASVLAAFTQSAARLPETGKELT